LIPQADPPGPGPGLSAALLLMASALLVPSCMAAGTSSDGNYGKILVLVNNFWYWIGEMWKA